MIGNYLILEAIPVKLDGDNPMLRNFLLRDFMYELDEIKRLTIGIPSLGFNPLFLKSDKIITKPNPQ